MSTVAKKVLMGSGAVAEVYEIEQSAIFNGDAGLYRTSDGGDRRTWTLSVWVKRNNLGGWQNIIGGATNSPADYVYINADNQVAINGYQSGVPTNFYTETTRVLRDVAAWYHIVVNFDSTQGTAANRMKIWINGVQETSFDVLISPSQNFQTQFNENGVTQYIGRDYTSSSWMKGQLAEMHFLDGVTKPASNFGETNSATGQWIPKEYEGGSYGTNGYYLKFVSGAIGTDSSGNGNTHTVQSLANTDVVIDSPTNNFATLNSALSATSAMVLSEGNLKGNFRSGGVGNASQTASTIAMPPGSGKWYWEMRNTYTGLGFILGIAPKGELPRMVSSGSFGDGYVNVHGKKTINAVETAYGTYWWANGQTYIVSCYYDSDNRKVGFKLNGTDQGYASEDVTAGSYVAVFTNASGGTGTFSTVVNFGQNGTFNGTVTAQGNADTNGIGDFYYAPPSGYKALCTANLPAPSIPLPSAHFNTALYAGNATTKAVTNVGFPPDFVWIKNRTLDGSDNVLQDKVRGSYKYLVSNKTNAENTNSAIDWFRSFDSDGFTVGHPVSGGGSETSEWNANGSNFVSWNWKANGAGSTNNDGATATVSANQTAGFSIVSYANPSGSDVAIGHGLGVKPELWIVKNRESAGDNFVYTTAIDGGGDYLKLNTTDASNAWSGTVPTTSLWYETFNGATGENFICYLFASKPGFSKIGSYTGNGSAVGTFINTGFKPAWIMIKRTDSAAEWVMFDIKRSPFNVVDKVLLAEDRTAEYTVANTMDINSNGFKMRDTHASRNANNGVYLYIAFAESPFKTANAR